MPWFVPRIMSALTLVYVVVVLAACSAASEGSAEPALPSSASPEQVASAYLHAAYTGNCALTAELTMAHTWSWCNDPKLLHYRSVESAVAVSASEAGRNEECVNFEMYTDGSSDGSMPTGWQPWGLCFVRTPAGWRLYDQGMG
jgi:hypothetical protein